MKKLLLSMFLMVAFCVPWVTQAQTPTMINESFDASTSIPTGWTQSGPHTWGIGSGSNSGSPAVAHSGSNCALFEGNGDSDNGCLISPVVDLSAATAPQISFWYANPTWGSDQNVLTVKYSTDGGTSWDTLDTYTTNVNVWTEVVRTLPSTAASSTFQVAFDGYDDYGYDILLDDIYIGTTPSCIRPNFLSATNITSTSADLSWQELGTATSWVEEYATTLFTPGANVGTVEIATDTMISLTNLLPNTVYYVYLHSDCGSGDTSTNISASFRTACGTTTLPYTEFFDDYTSSSTSYPSCWSRPVTQGSYPHVTNGYASSSSNSVIFAGASTMVSPRMPVTAHELILRFKLRSESTSSSGNMLIGVTANPDSVGVNTGFELVQTIHPVTSGSWYDYEVPFANTTMDDTCYIVFQQSSTTTNWYYWLDNVEIIKASTCPKPINPAISEVVATSAHFSWTDTASVGNYTFKYGTSNNEVFATDSIILTEDSTTIYNLTPSTIYYAWVRSDCSDEGSNWTSFGSFRTACLPDTLPYVQDFDTWQPGQSSTTTHIDFCWYQFSNYSTPTYYPFVSNYIAHSGNNALYFYKSGTSYFSYVALPIFETGVDSLQVSFWLYKENNNYTNGVQVGVMTNVADITSFVPVSTCSPAALNTWEHFTVYLDAAGITNGRICFYAPNSFGYNYVYLDDVEVSVKPLCGPVANLQVGNIAANAASLQWETTYGEFSSFNVEYKEATDSVWTSAITSDRYFFLSNLNASTTYDVRVNVVCSEENSLYVTSSFTTLACLAGGEIEVGDVASTLSTANNPSNICYGYSYTQQIYTATEMAQVGDTIRGIAFFNTNSTTYNGRPTKIYMGHTQQADFASTSAIIPIDSLTLVYDTTWDVVSGWNTFNFDNAFIYNGTSNLVIALDDNTGDYQCTPSFKAFTATANRAIYFYQDGSDILPTAPSANNNGVINEIPNVKFLTPCNNNVTCMPPSLLVTNVMSTEIDLAWSAGLNESAWSVEYKESTDSVWTMAVASTSNTTYQLTNLGVSTIYDVRVSALCGGETRSRFVTVRTNCDIYSIPLTEDFEAYANEETGDPCWVSNAVTSSQAPYVQRITGNTAMFLLPPTSYVALPEVTAPLTTLQLRFRYLAAVSGVRLVAGVMDNPNLIATFHPVDTLTTTGAALSEYFTVNLSSLTDTGKYVALYSIDNNAYVDDINLETIPQCTAPTAVVSSNVTTTDADLSWTAEGTPSSYLVEYGPTGFTAGTGTFVSTTTNTITLSGLNPSTTYSAHVYALCSATDTSLSSNYCTFQTECAAMTLPYFQNFDNCNAPALTETGILPNCWTNPYMLSASASAYQRPQIYSSNSYANSGDYSLRMYYRGLVVLPELDATIPMDTVRVRFSNYVNNLSYGLIIGVCDSNTNGCEASFVPVDTVYNMSTNTHEDHTIYMANYAGTGRYIAFMNYHPSYSYSYNYVDDIIIDETPTCLPVQDFHSTSNTSSSITLAWTDLRNAPEWQLSYDTLDTISAASMVINTNPYTVQNLVSGTHYYFYIRSICSAGDTGEWVGPLMATPGTWNMRVNHTDTITMCGGVIYDDGGLTGMYSSSQTSILVIYPDTTTQAVQITGTFSAESCCDHLTIYDGVGTATVLAAISGSGSTPVMVGTITSESGPITIKFESDGSVNYDGYELFVSCVSNTCPKPTDIHATGASMNSLSVDWTDVVTPVEWEVEYGLMGFAQGTGTSMVVTSHPITINGLDTLTNYDVYVRPICTPGSDTGRWAGPATLSTAICDNATITTTGAATEETEYFPGYAVYNYSLSQVIIDSAELASLNGDITAFEFNVLEDEEGSQYFNNTQIYFTPTIKSSFADEYDFVDVDSTSVLVFDGSLNTIGTGWKTFMLDTIYTWDGHSNLIVTIDRNHGAWASSATYAATNTSTNKAIYAYNDSYNPDPTNMAGYDGYTEVVSYRPNYRFTACGGGACHTPAIVSETHDYGNSTLTWAGDGTNYEVAVKAASDGVWPAETPVQGTTYTFTNLSAQTSYMARVRQNCDTLGYSEWATISFTTDSLPCFAPSNLHVEAATGITADLAWTAGTTETQWIVKVWTSAAIVDSVLTTNNPYSVSGLTTGIQYFAAVQAYCGNGAEVSDMSDTITFTTTECDPVTGVAVADVTNTTASVSWSNGDNNTGSWEIKYGEAGFLEGDEGIVSVIVNATPATITGLTPNTEYDVYVRAVCGTGWNSAWAQKQTFTTTNGTEEGINGVDDQLNVTIYPNPTSGNTTIILTGIDGEVEISIVDMSGRRISSEKLTCTGDCVKTLNVDNLSQGAYFVRIQSQSTNMVKKLIVK